MMAVGGILSRSHNACGIAVARIDQVHVDQCTDTLTRDRFALQLQYAFRIGRALGNCAAGLLYGALCFGLGLAQGRDFFGIFRATIQHTQIRVVVNGNACLLQFVHK